MIAMLGPYGASIARCRLFVNCECTFRDGLVRSDSRDKPGRSTGRRPDPALGKARVQEIGQSPLQGATKMKARSEQTFALVESVRVFSLNARV